MFERQIALEKAQGYRGPATRFIARVPVGPEARAVVRDMAACILALAALQVLLGISGSPVLVVLGIAIALPAALLFFVHSHVIALLQLGWFLLLFVAVLTLFPPRGAIATLSWVALFYLAARASVACARLRQSTAPPPVEPDSDVDPHQSPSSVVSDGV